MVDTNDDRSEATGNRAVVNVAGTLAARLAEQLKLKGNEATMKVIDDPHYWSDVVEGMVTQEDIDQARKEWDQAIEGVPILHSVFDSLPQRVREVAKKRLAPPETLAEEMALDPPAKAVDGNPFVLVNRTQILALLESRFVYMGYSPPYAASMAAAQLQRLVVAYSRDE